MACYCVQTVVVCPICDRRVLFGNMVWLSVDNETAHEAYMCWECYDTNNPDES